MHDASAQPTATPLVANEDAPGQAGQEPRQEQRPLPASGPNARPLGAYAALVSAFMGAHLTASLLARRHPQLGATDLLVLSLASFRLGRMVNTDEVTTFLRAPFVELALEGSGDDASVREQPTGTGLRVAIGQLVKCSTCSAFWGAGLQLWGLMLAPRVTRPFVWIIAANGAGELIELVAERLQKQR